MPNVQIESLVGEVLDYVDVCGDEILLTTRSGRKIKLYHEQDCCESVEIEDTQGDWYKLLGKPLVVVEKEEKGLPNDKRDDSVTETVFTFKTDKDTVISRWIGTSNGYYSERVDIKELTKG